jgi:hypothetical protein
VAYASQLKYKTMKKYLLNLKSILGIMLLLCSSSLVNAQEVMEKDSLLPDFRQMVKYLTETHPDPFSAYGGKVMCPTPSSAEHFYGTDNI